MNGKLKWIGLVALSGALLVGCEEEDVVFEKQNIVEVEDIMSDNITGEQEQVSSLLPENIRNGTVSEETYSEVVRFIKEHSKYAKEDTSYVKKMSNDYALISTDSFQKEYGDFLNDYDVFMKGIALHPSTPADFELSEHMVSIEYYTLDYTEQMRMYIKNIDSYYYENGSKSLNKRTTSYKALMNTMIKYDLFTE